MKPTIWNRIKLHWHCITKMFSKEDHRYCATLNGYKIFGIQLYITQTIGCCGCDTYFKNWFNNTSNK